MAKGITETDVWQAADALLLEGGRPTIERVRQKIGRGSPNTVTPYLDSWFKHLGGRIKDPGAFSAPAALPDPIHQAAQHFWEVALAEARKETDEKLTAGLAAAEPSVARAAQRVDAAESTTVRLRAELAQATNDLLIANDLISKEALEHATTRAHLESARDRNADLSERLRLLEGQVQAARYEAKSEVAAADARAASAEKRAALDMDRERMARSNAEKRLAAVETKLEKTQGQFSAERTRHASEIAAIRADVLQLRRDESIKCRQLVEAQAQVKELSMKLLNSETEIQTAEMKARVSKELLAQLAPGRAEPRKRRSKKPSS